ncbi:MAG TPA: hypothetical protein VD999_06495 [Vitreimonas sp.]|nr:hypothetical protein [Vitreimonas sp.]
MPQKKLTLKFKLLLIFVFISLIYYSFTSATILYLIFKEHSFYMLLNEIVLFILLWTVAQIGLVTVQKWGVYLAAVLSIIVLAQTLMMGLGIGNIHGFSLHLLFFVLILLNKDEYFSQST